MSLHNSTEESLLLRRRARQRLVGAVVWLALAALVLPWLFDSLPRAEHAGLARVAGSNAGLSVSIEGSPPAPVARAPAVPPSPSVAAGAQAQQALPVSRPAARIAVAEIKPPDKAPVGAQTLPVANAVALKKPATALATDKKNTHKQHAVSQRQFVVQLGVFSNADNVRQLRKHLQAMGIESYTEAMPSGATRVRVGPYASRTEADRVLASIRLADMPAQIVPVTR